MNLNAYKKNRYFPLRSLPDVVIYHIAQYLSPMDLGNMSKVNQHFRRLFNSPQFWNGVKILMPRKSMENNHSKSKIDPEVLSTIKLRGITELELWSVYHVVGSEIVVILHSLPQLEGLSLHTTTISICKALQQFVSSGNLINLRKLGFGCVDKRCWELSIIQHFFTDLFKQLPRLEEISFGHDEVCSADLYPLELGSDLQRALCYSGKLTSVSLMHLTITRSSLNVTMANNPHLQTLSLGFIDDFVEDDPVNPAICSSLTSLNLHHSSERITNSLLNWAFAGTESNRNLTSLNVSYCPCNRVFCNSLLFKLPALRKLNLTKCCFPKNVSFEKVHHVQNLEWLELKGCNRISGQELWKLSKSVGRTLRYLGLADVTFSPLITDNHLRDLAFRFPVLRSLDLSGCEQISDALLVEWYIKHDETRWPKLRKLVLKGCGNISQEVVNSVRLKTRNQLLVDL